MPKKRKQGISLGHLPGYDAGIRSSPALAWFLKRFFGLLRFRVVHGLQVLGQGLSISLPRLVEGLAHSVQPTYDLL